MEIWNFRVGVDDSFSSSKNPRFLCLLVVTMSCTILTQAGGGQEVPLLQDILGSDERLESQTRHPCVCTLSWWSSSVSLVVDSTGEPHTPSWSCVISPLRLCVPIGYWVRGGQWGVRHSSCLLGVCSVARKLVNTNDKASPTIVTIAAKWNMSGRRSTGCAAMDCR